MVEAPYLHIPNYRKGNKRSEKGDSLNNVTWELHALLLPTPVGVSITNKEEDGINREIIINLGHI